MKKIEKKKAVNKHARHEALERMKGVRERISKAKGYNE